MGEELNYILQNSIKEYTGKKNSEGCNVEIDKKADETEKSALQGEDSGRKNRKFPCFMYNLSDFFI
jgi:hypothetical protein